MNSHGKPDTSSTPTGRAIGERETEASNAELCRQSKRLPCTGGFLEVMVSEENGAVR